MELTAREKSSRSVSLELDYVHEVYERIGRYLVYAEDPLKDTVNKFLDGLEPGSLVADIGCGDGRHLRYSSCCFSVGADCCLVQTKLARKPGKEAVLGSNLRLPFRPDSFDGVLSIGVIHHLATKDRRILALRELTRILRVGGRVLIAVRSQDTEPKDVLIPWYDVKSKKDEQRWIDQDSGEYDLEDNSDCDSISLPSSDDEDHSANFFPPMSSANGWLPESQSRSIDDDQQSSKSVPNSNSLIPINACYDYFRKALRRLSSANSTEDDASTLEKLRRADSAIPPSPSNSHDPRLEFVDCLSVNLSESLQRLINDNYIELLNLEESNAVPFHHQFESTGRHIVRPYVPSPQETSGHTFFHPSNKNRLMRSLSDIYKNMPGLWSSKVAKSCSDLKSQTSTDKQNSREERSNRLKRSRTTATCNSSFDAPLRLESIGEYEMTLTEADKIVNDFLYSSMSSIETLKNREPSLEFGPYNPLSQSDIVNGNIMPGCNSPVLDAKESEHQAIDCNFGTLGNFAGASGNLEHFFATQLLGTQIKCCEEDSNILQFEDSLLRDLEFSNEFDQEDNYLPKQSNGSFKSQAHKLVIADYIGNQSENKGKKTEKGPYESVTTKNLKDTEHCSDLSVHATSKELSGDQKSVDMRYFKTGFFQEEPTNLDDFRFDHSNTKQVLSCTSIEDQTYNVHKNLSKNTSNFKDSKFNPESHFLNHTSESKGSKYNKCKNSLASNDSLQVSSKNLDKSKEEFNPDVSTLTNTNIHRTFIAKTDCLQVCVEALGPFYDTDIKVASEMGNSTLTSYYSMPELHNLSHFKKDYNIYNSTIAKRTHSDTLKHENKSKEILQHKIIKQLQGEASSSMTKEFKESKANDIIRGSRRNEVQLPESNLPEPSSQAEIEVGNLDAPMLKHAKENIYISERKHPVHSTTDHNIADQFPRRKSVSSTTENSQNISCKKNSVHKICSKSIDKVAKKRSRSIDAINDMLHFNCANCAKYDKINLTEPATHLRSFTLGQKYSEDTIFENEFEVNVNQNLHPELFSTSSGLRNFASKEEQKHQLNKLDEIGSKSSALLRNGGIAVVEGKNTYSKACLSDYSEIDPLQEEIGGTKRKYKQLLHSTALSTTTIKDVKGYKQPQQNCFKPEEYSFEEQKDLSQITKSSGCSDVWNSEASKWNPIGQVSNQMLETYHSKSSDHLKQKKHLPCNGQSLDFDKNAILCDEHFHDTSTSNLPSSSHDLHDFESHSKKTHGSSSVSNVTIPHSISNANTPPHGFENVKNKRKNTAKTADLHLDHGQYSQDAKNRSKNPIVGKENVSIVKAESLAEEQISTEDDPPPKNVNYFYGRVEEEGAAVAMHRYHHFFEKEELANLIEEYVEDLHVLDFFQEQSHWCIIAEKVRVWTI